MKIYVTFGQQYRREIHPVDNRAHPDGYFEYDVSDDMAGDVFGIKVDSFNKLYEFITNHIGFCFSNYYTDNDFNKSYYPRGKLNDDTKSFLYEDYFKL